MYTQHFVHIHVQICVHIYIYIQICTYIDMYMCVYIYTYMYIHTYICTCVYIYMYIHIYVHVCVYIYIYTHMYGLQVDHDADDLTQWGCNGHTLRKSNMVCWHVLHLVQGFSDHNHQYLDFSFQDS